MLNLPRQPPDDIALAIRMASEAHGTDLDFLTAIAWIETRFRPDLTSPAGAEGLFQFMPATWGEYGQGRDPFDPIASADAAARYLRDLLGRYDGDFEAAAAAYNWGMGNLRKTHWPDPGWRLHLPPETRRYVTLVRELLGLDEHSTNGGNGSGPAIAGLLLVGLAFAVASGRA